MKKIIVLVNVIAAIVIGVTFTLKNPQSVSLSYYFGIDWQGPVSWLVIVVFILGVVFGIVSCLLMVLKRRIHTSLSSSTSEEK